MISLIRIFDIIVALTALLVFSPVLLVIPLLIFIDDRGPIFFCQPRLGRHKRIFNVWKFRTMRDGKVTRVGKWLRATALDEFLQFLLILRGKMSTVGPRPLTQDDVTRLGWDDADHRSRWSIIPGVTGLVQIYGGTSAAHSWELEQLYLTNKSFYIDTKIICLSAIVTICGKRKTKTWFPLDIQEHTNAPTLTKK